MDKTFINIGSVVRDTEWARVKYHPLLSKRNLVIKGKTSSKIIETIASFELHVNMDNQSVQINEADAIPDQLDVMRYSLSSADTKIKYLIGSAVIKKADVETQLSIEKFETNYVKNYGDILTSDSFITKYRNLLEEKIQVIKDATSKYDYNDDVKEIAFIVRITCDGVTDVAHAFQTCLDDIDEMFLSMSHTKDRGYIFTNAFYSMFNYGKYETKGVKTMYDNSVPYYSKADFTSLFYAKKIYEQTSYNIDRKSGYSISIFPNYDGLTMEEIEKLLFQRKNLFDFNMVCKEIESLIHSRTERNQKNRREKTMIPLLLKFDIYYRYALGMAGSQNMLRLTGIRYSQLLNIRNHIKDSYEIVYGKETVPEKFLVAVLFSLYKDNNDSPDRYMTTIFRTLQNIYQEKYVVAQQADFCLLDKAQFVARKGDDKIFRDTWNNLFNIYKFLKTMENKNFVLELQNSPSYQLGVELAKFESGWKRGRENIKKTIQLFSGNISKRVHTVQHVYDHYIDLVERLIRNDAFYGNHNELLELLKSDIDFNKNEFIMGFFTEKNTFREKTEDVEESVSEKLQDN